jgi:hypothetical protein
MRENYREVACSFVRKKLRAACEESCAWRAKKTAHGVRKNLRTESTYQDSTF